MTEWPPPANAPAAPNAPTPVGSRGGKAPDETSRRQRLLLAVVVMAACGLSILVNTRLFPLYSLDHDDAMYVFEARLLREGNLTLPRSDDPFFRPWASGVRNGRVVMVYAPAWPAVIAAAETLGRDSRMAPALVAGALVLAVYLLSLELFRRRVALIAAMLVAFSPIVIILSGTYLSYPFQLLLGTMFVYLLLSGIRTGSAVRLALAGAALGLATFARPFDALLVAFPLGVWLLVVGRKRPQVLVRKLAILALGAAPFVALLLAYDAHTMGRPLRLPFTVTGATNTLGFGRRGIFPSSSLYYGMAQARASLDNIWALPEWVLGGVLLVPLAVAGLVWSRPAGGRRIAVAAVGLTVPIGYLFFWSPYAIGHIWIGLGSLGPFYHLAMVVPLALFGAVGLDGLWRRSPTVLVAAVAGMLMLTGLSLPPKISNNLTATRYFRRALQPVERAHLRNALVFLPNRPDDGFRSPVPSLQDRPSFANQVLYANDLGERDLDLIGQLSSRTPYRLDLERDPSRGELEGSTRLRAIHVSRGAMFRAHVRVRNPGHRSCVLAYASSTVGRVTIILDETSTSGKEYDASFTVRAGGQLALDPSLKAGSFSVGVAFGGGPNCSLNHVDRYERRFFYRTAGRPRMLEVEEPARGWRKRVVSRHGSVWFRADVDGVIRELS